MAALQVAVTESATLSDFECDCVNNPKEAANYVARSLGLCRQQEETVFKILNEEDLDPVLVIKPIPTWRPPPGVIAQDILEDIAKWRMPVNRRRDDWEWEEGRHWIFHFDYFKDINGCRKYIRTKYPRAFGLNQGQLDQGMINLPGHSAFADAMVIYKTDVRQDDVFLYDFFTH